MKIRDGHVSNSSSSSFVSVMTKATFEKAKAASSEAAKKLADIAAQHGRLGNEDIVLIAMQAWEGEYFAGNSVLDEIPKWREAWREFIGNIPKDEEFGTLQGDDC